MNRFRLALTGCLRRPLRSGLTACGVALAVAAAFSLLAFQRGYRTSLSNELDRLGAHILVAPKGCPYDAASLALHGANWPCHLKSSYLDEVRAVPGVEIAAPVFMSAHFDPNGQAAVYVGMDTNMLALKPGWRIQGMFPGPGEVMPGAEIARRLGWQSGRRVDLPGVQGPGRTISGILAPTHSADDAFVSLPLEDAQHLFRHTNELTHILIRLGDPNRLDSVVAALRGCGAGMHMNVVPVAHLFSTIQALINSTRWFLGCATLVALLAAGAGVGASCLIAVAERTREIGVLRALGASRTGVFGLFWLESILICLAGAIAGMGIAFLSMKAVEGWLRTRLPFAPTGELMIWEWGIAAACLILAVVLGSLSVILPAWHAATLPPVRALRSKGGGS